MEREQYSTPADPNDLTKPLKCLMIYHCLKFPKERPDEVASSPHRRELAKELWHVR